VLAQVLGILLLGEAPPTLRAQEQIERRFALGWLLSKKSAYSSSSVANL